MKIAVVGIGYVGLALGCLLSKHNDVCFLDISEKKVSQVNSYVSPLKDEYIEKYLDTKPKSIQATLDKATAFKKAKYVIIATPTNYNERKKYFDTTSIEENLDFLHDNFPKVTVIIKSTIPIGYTDKMKLQYPDLKIIFSPEFLREGKALYDNLYPNRIIIGETSKEAKHFAKLLTEAAEKENIPVLYMSSKEAETVKLFANTYLALRVAFFNELDTYAELNNLNTNTVIEGVCLDPRIGSYYNNPSFGYGGYCLPKDTRQLEQEYNDIPQRLITAVIQANNVRKSHIVKRILQKKPKVVGTYRLSMKDQSDNFRYSAVKKIIRLLLNRGIEVIVYEPQLTEKMFDGARVQNDLEAFKRESDIIITNRSHKDLADVKEKVYTRDVYTRD